MLVPFAQHMSLTRNKIALLMLLGFLHSSSFCQHWTNVLTGQSNDMTEGTSVTFTSGGSLCFAGNYRANFNVGGSLLLGSDVFYGFIGKQQPNGNVLWTRRISSNRDLSISTIRCKNQILMVSGNFSDSLFIGSDTLINSFQQGIFVAFYDTVGNYLGSVAPNVQSASIFDAEFTDDFKIVVTGQFYQTFELGNFSVNVGNNFNMFCFKFDLNNLETDWLFSSDGRSTSGNGLAVDQHNNVFIAGSYGDETSILGQSLENNNSNHNFYLLKVNANSDFQWVHTIRGEGQVHGSDVAVNEAGESFFAGDFQLFVDSLNGAVISADGASSAMVGKLSPDGQLVWIESIGGLGEDKGARVILDSLQAPIFLIESGANPYVGNVPVSTNGFKEPLITKLNPENGEFVWGKTISAKNPTGNVQPLDIARWDAKLAVTGRNRTGLVFEETLFEAPYNREFFVAVIQDTTYIPLDEEPISSVLENVYIQNAIKIYPNPSTEYFILETSIDIHSLTIYSLNGQFIEEQTVLHNNQPVQFGQKLHRGTYLVRISSQETTKEFIVMKH
jgi:hypothetical protein